MFSAVKALAGTVTGVVTLGLGYTIASHEIHYWTQPSHLPIALTVAAGLTAAGVGGTSVWAKGKLEGRKERKATEELAEIREQLKAKEALPEAEAPVVDLGYARGWEPKRVIDLNGQAVQRRSS